MHPLLIPSSHAELDIAARELVFSGYCQQDQSQCYLKMLLGTTLSLTIFESIHGITFQADPDGKPGKVIVEPFALIERVIGRSGDCEVKVASSTEKQCELNFFQNAKIKGQLLLTRADLEEKGITGLTLAKLFQITYAQGVQKHFPHLFGHKFYLRAELSTSKQEQVNALVAQSDNKVLTADKLTIPKHPRKLPLAINSQRLLDWQRAYQALPLDNPIMWDAHLAELLGFDFLTEAQKDDLFDELLGHGINYGVEYNAETQKFHVPQYQ